MLSRNEQYQHPKWQRKRLEIMRRDKWECLCCGKTNVPLHVHHLYYEKDFHVWDYDDDALVTVCRDCHNKIHNDLAKLSGIIAFKILSGEIDAASINMGEKKPNKKYRVREGICECNGTKPFKLIDGVEICGFCKKRIIDNNEICQAG